MGNIKQINIKNWTSFFFNDMINIKDFDPSLLKIDKESYKNIGIYNIGYITIKKIDNCEDIDSVNPLYLMIGEVIGHTKEKNGNKYLVFDSLDGNKEVLKKYTELWNEIKNEIKTINGGKVDEYDKDFMKIKFDTDDDLPLNKQLKFHMSTIVIRSVFEDEGKFYPSLFRWVIVWVTYKCQNTI